MSRAVMGRLVVGFGGRSLAVDYEGPRAAALVELVLRHVPPEVDSDCPCALVVRDEGSLVTLAHNGTIVTRGPPGHVASELSGMCCYHLHSRCDAGLLFHAAAVEKDGRALMIPAASGSGKTTLAAFLLSRGWRYVTDEMCFFGLPDAPEGVRFDGYARALNFKLGSRQVWSAWRRDDAAAHHLAHDQGDVVAPEALGAAVTTTARLAAVVYVLWQAGAELRLTRSSPAGGAAALLSSLVNGARLEGHGFRRVAALARRIPVHELRYGSFEGLEHSLAPCLDNDDR